MAEERGASLRRVRRRRETIVAALAGDPFFPDRRLGGARWFPAGRAGELRTTLPCHLGHRSRRRGALRAAGARGGGPRPGPVGLPAPRRRAPPLPRRGRWGGPDAPFNQRGRTKAAQVRVVL